MTAGRGFTDLVGCRLPLQLASLGGPVGTPALAAAVSEAGGLGMIPNPSSAAEVEQRIAAMALYAGESVDAVTRIQPASEIVAELTASVPSRTT